MSSRLNQVPHPCPQQASACCSQHLGHRGATLACKGGGGGPILNDWTDTVVLYIVIPLRGKSSVGNQLLLMKIQHKEDNIKILISSCNRNLWQKCLFEDLSQVLDLNIVTQRMSQHTVKKVKRYSRPGRFWLETFWGRKNR